MANDIKIKAMIRIVLTEDDRLSIEGPEDQVAMVGLLEIAKARILNPVPPKQQKPSIVPYNGPLPPFGGQSHG